MKACIATGHPAVTRAAAQVLHAGGNAFDAAVAAAFTSAVVEPALTSLGGGGFLLAVRPQQEPVLVDFFVDTPGAGLPADADHVPHFDPVDIQFKGARQTFNIGYGAAAVPGVVRGLLHVHEQFGRVPLETVTAPAIALAEQGCAVDAMMAYTFDILHPILTADDEGRAMFGRGDGPKREGDHIDNPALGAFLRGLPGTAAALYEGQTARSLARLMRQKGGLLTAKDLAAYRVIERAPLAVQYHGVTALLNPPPSLGGSLIGLSLALLDEVPLSTFAWGSARHIGALGGMMHEVDRLRAQGVTHPDQLDGAARAAFARRQSTGGTTHCTISDADGNVASMTTSNGEGCGHFIPGTGIMLNNMMGEDDLHPGGFHQAPAGERVASMMAPTVILDEQGRPTLGLGSGGSKRIRTAVLQVLCHVVDHGLALQDAIDAPRLHIEDDRFQLEPGFDDAVRQSLAPLAPVNVWPSQDLYFGGVHAVVAGRAAGADRRRGGATLVLD